MITNPLITLPQNPRNYGKGREAETIHEFANWAIQVQKLLAVMYQTLASRTNEMIQQGVVALRPAATGRNLFYWATDTHHLYYDDGAWRTIL